VVVPADTIDDRDVELEVGREVKEVDVEPRGSPDVTEVAFVSAVIDPMAVAYGGSELDVPVGPIRSMINPASASTSTTGTAPNANGSTLSGSLFISPSHTIAYDWNQTNETGSAIALPPGSCHFRHDLRESPARQVTAEARIVTAPIHAGPEPVAESVMAPPGERSDESAVVSVVFVVLFDVPVEVAEIEVVGGSVEAVVVTGIVAVEVDVVAEVRSVVEFDVVLVLVLDDVVEVVV
jgi:hypothetical protein